MRVSARPLRPLDLVGSGGAIEISSSGALRSDSSSRLRCSRRYSLRTVHRTQTIPLDSRPRVLSTRSGQTTWGGTSSRGSWGAQIDLQVGVLSILFPLALGTILGCLTGYLAD